MGKYNEQLRAIEQNQITEASFGYLSQEECLLVFRSLLVNTSVKHLNIQLSTIVFSALADVLNSNKSLNSIRLYKNDFDITEFHQLTKALETNQSLTQLEIDCYDDKLGPNEAAILAEALKINQALTQLSLADNEFGSIGIGAIAEALKINKILTKLMLYNNQIDTVGIACIAEALKVNDTLLQLDLGNNQLGSAEVKILAEALKINQTLNNVYFFGNRIDDEGANSLANVLKTSQSLYEIDLRHNQISDIGVKALAKSLKRNQTLTLLNLGSNKLTNSGITIYDAIGERCGENYRYIQRRRDAFVSMLIQLGRAQDTQTQPPIASLPLELLLYIIRFLPAGSLHKRPEQLYYCAEFTLTNLDGIYQRLSRQYDRKPLIQETKPPARQKTTLSCFRFFAPIQLRNVPAVEHQVEEASNEPKAKRIRLT